MSSSHIRAGDLRTPVWLGRPVVGQDTAGGEALTWEEWKTWANIEPVKGRELQSATATKGRIDYTITVRTSDGWIPDERWRIREAESGTVYNIIAALMGSKPGAAECLAERAQGSSDGR